MSTGNPSGSPEKKSPEAEEELAYARHGVSPCWQQKLRQRRIFEFEGW